LRKPEIASPGLRSQGLFVQYDELLLSLNNIFGFYFLKADRTAAKFRPRSKVYRVSDDVLGLIFSTKYLHHPMLFVFLFEMSIGLGIIKVECGSQFSVALSNNGSVYTWGKGDYHRLGHGVDEHVRRPKK
jgi:hypothetical protein